jgi:indolepyruvate ferredoxin oxidoreductase beta subunit
MSKQRIILAGVGGQGTLTATNLLAFMALDQNIPVTSGEIHGMAQRGGVVESTLLLGGYLSPRISLAEADILLGFEPLETLRALPYLKPGGLVVSNTEPTLPVAVNLGQETYPSQETIQDRVSRCAGEVHFIPCRTLGIEAGTVQSANMVLLGGFCATGGSPFSLDDLKEGISAHLPQKIVPVNLQAAELGRLALEKSPQEH